MTGPAIVMNLDGLGLPVPTPIDADLIELRQFGVMTAFNPYIAITPHDPPAAQIGTRSSERSASRSRGSRSRSPRLVQPQPDAQQQQQQQFQGFKFFLPGEGKITWITIRQDLVNSHRYIRRSTTTIIKTATSQGTSTTTTTTCGPEMTPTLTPSRSKMFEAPPRRPPPGPPRPPAGPSGPLVLGL